MLFCTCIYVCVETVLSTTSCVYLSLQREIAWECIKQWAAALCKGSMLSGMTLVSVHYSATVTLSVRSVQAGTLPS